MKTEKTQIKAQIISKLSFYNIYFVYVRNRNLMWPIFKTKLKPDSLDKVRIGEGD